jgi:hypothetical protein
MIELRENFIKGSAIDRMRFNRQRVPAVMYKDRNGFATDGLVKVGL